MAMAPQTLKEFPEQVQVPAEKEFPIVLVDDSAPNLLLLEKLLSKDGYTRIHKYSSAMTMLKDVQTNQCTPGLILLDIYMPDMDGIEALKRLQEDQNLKDIPVIMVTAEKEDKFLGEAFAIGAIDYIRKPINRIELLARVHAALRLKREMEIRKIRERELVQAKEALEKANLELKRLAIEDGLTGLANRVIFRKF